MSEFVEVEWFGREQKIGIVLTYDEHDGFKARMSPLPSALVDGKYLTISRTEEEDIQYLMREAAKIPFEWAWGIFGKRMKVEWMHRHLADEPSNLIRYDGVNYDSKNWKRDDE